MSTSNQLKTGQKAGKAIVGVPVLEKNILGKRPPRSLFGPANTLRQEQQKAEPKPKKRSLSNRNRKFLRMLNPENYLRTDFLLEHLPYLLFVALLALFYIGNSHYAFKRVREINKLEAQLVESHDEYTATNSDLMGKSRMSQVADGLADTGIKQLTTAPQKIFVNKPEDK